MEARHREEHGEQVRESAATLMRKAGELRDRRAERLAEIDRQRVMQTPPPRVSAAARLIPATWVDTSVNDGEVDVPEG
ncbi:hypothetical protein, partial [Bacillus cereus]|uniref:hypothetical protein n=1 Tax=Bacillus cereus TaxID=1396 RepID=UPI002112A293|nr:hypothetical protein [Bacillus cereus]